MGEQRVNVTPDPLGLRGLPTFEPATALWPRVLAAQQRRQRSLRWQRGGACVAAAVFALGTVVLLPRASAPLQQDIAAGQRASQALERQWRRVAPAAGPGGSNVNGMRIIDADLQAAYDRGASAREIAALWRVRNEVLRGLIAAVRNSDADTAPLLTQI